MWQGNLGNSNVYKTKYIIMTMIHKIYHIPGIKIGCTHRKVSVRVKEQGYNEFEVLEEHTCKYVASKREKELQKQYGYRTDGPHYWQSLENSSKGGIVQGKANAESGHTAKIAGLGGKKGGITTAKMNVESGRWNEIRLLGASAAGKIQASIIHTCPHCGKIGKGPSMRRWHFSNCKSRLTIQD